MFICVLYFTVEVVRVAGTDEHRGEFLEGVGWEVWQCTTVL